MAKVDILVAIYNVQDYIEETLNSLSAQTFADIRVVCVDDGSTDKSGEITRSFCAKDSRFVYIYKENGGLSSARNTGLSQVTSPYLMFVDGDDYVEKEMVEDCLKAIESEGSDVVVFPYTAYYHEEGRREFVPLSMPKGSYRLSEHKELLAYTPNASWNKCFRSSLYLDNGILFPLGFRHQDMGTTPKILALADKITYLDKSYYNYRIDRAGNITQQVDKNIDHILYMAKEIVQWYKEKELFETYKDELNYLININFIQSLRKAMKLKDRRFVFAFVDDCFAFKKEVFGSDARKYVIDDRHDRIYLNKILLKAYYYYAQRSK